jgi:hypothetical protein
MCRNVRERGAEESLARLHAVPWRRARGMRQRHAISRVPGVVNAKFFADDHGQRAFAEKLRDGKLAHRQHEMRPQQGELAPEPAGAMGDFVGRGHAIAAPGALAGKTAADSGKINTVACLVLAPPERLVEPLEERPARGPRERSAELRLLVSGRLADEQHATRDRAADDHRLVHARTKRASAQGG